MRGALSPASLCLLKGRQIRRPGTGAVTVFFAKHQGHIEPSSSAAPLLGRGTERHYPMHRSSKKMSSSKLIVGTSDSVDQGNGRSVFRGAGCSEVLKLSDCTFIFSGLEGKH